jgi:membrane protein DedA with SNARE-associated domain
MLAFQITSAIGLPLIFVLVMAETCGLLPMSPGEVAVISGGIEASDHKLALLGVLVFAAAGAIVGDNIGYLIGRIGGRRVLEKGGPFASQRRKALELADPFFARRGGSAVFYGRWLPVLRVFASWFAGGAKMKWRTFFVWNAAGGITWAVSMGLIGYYVGPSAKSIFNSVGSIGMIAVVLSVVGFVVFRKIRRRRRAQQPTPEPSLAQAAVGLVSDPTPAVATTSAPSTTAISVSRPPDGATKGTKPADGATRVRTPPDGPTAVRPTQPRLETDAQATVIRPRKRPPDS